MPDGGWFVGEAEGFEVASFEDGTGAEDGFGIDVELGLSGRVGRWSGLAGSGKGVRFLLHFRYESWCRPDVGQDPENQAVGVRVHSNSGQSKCLDCQW